MLSALLGAVCAASMAFAPALVEPSSNGLKNDGNITSVRSAFYDSSQVSNYGTESGKFYNYTNYYLTGSEEDTALNDDYANGLDTATPNGGTVSIGSVGYNSNLNQTYFSIGGNYTYTQFLFTEQAPNTYYPEDSTLEVAFDVYINGALCTDYITTNVNEEGYFVYSCKITGEVDGFSNTSYIWIFNHGTPYSLGTDTVADIAEGLTSGIGTVATGIGGGLGSLMQNIFLVGTVDGEGNFTATGLSTFGIVTICFAGLALALGLSRWLVGFATSLGERNR